MYYTWEVEDWGIKSVRKKNLMYLDKNWTILYSNDTRNSKSKVIILLKNGIISDLKSVEVNQKLYSDTNVYLIA